MKQLTIIFCLLLIPVYAQAGFVGYLKADTAATLQVGPFLDSTDGDTDEGALTISQADVRLSKNGANIAQKNEATSCTYDEVGFYSCPIDATDTNTEGRLQLIVHESGALTVIQEYMVVNANVFDSLYAAATTDYLQVDSIQISGDATAADNAELAYDGTGFGFTNCTMPTVTTLTGHTAQTGDNFARLGAPAGASIAADIAAVPTAAEIQAEMEENGASLLDTISDKLPTNYIMGSSDQTDQDDDIAAILLDTGTTIPGTITTAQNDLDIITGATGVVIADDSITAAKIANAAIDAATFAADVDAEVATYIWNAATVTYGGAGTYGQAVEDTVADTNELQTDDVPGLIAALNDPTAAAIADAVWDETLADHLGAGSTGNALNAAGAAGDPWSTALPGAYGAGTAGKIVGDNLNAPVGTVDTVVDGIATAIGTPGDLGSGATVADNLADIEAQTDDIGVAGAGLTEAGGTGDQLTAIDLPNQTMDITGNITGNLSGSVGSVTGAVGSVTGNVGGNVTGSVGSLVGHTVQTGDTYALAAGATGFAAIDTVVDSILVDTAVIGALGAGLTAIPWNAAWDAEVESEVDDSIGGGTGTALTAIPWNAAWDAEVQSEADDALVAHVVGFKKNTAVTAFSWLMVDDTDHVTPETGLQATLRTTGNAQISCDGGAFADLANIASINHVASGIYEVDFTAGEMNCDSAVLRFLAAGTADQRTIYIKTSD